MNIQSQKLKLIKRIIEIKDKEKINQVSNILKEVINTSEPGKIRKRGIAKGFFTYVSEDFDEPLEEFKDYMP